MLEQVEHDALNFLVNPDCVNSGYFHGLGWASDVAHSRDANYSTRLNVYGVALGSEWASYSLNSSNCCETTHFASYFGVKTRWSTVAYVRYGVVFGIEWSAANDEHLYDSVRAIDFHRSDDVTHLDVAMSLVKWYLFQQTIDSAWFGLMCLVSM